jgi:hypothetical protein
MGYIFTARAMGYLTGALISGRMFDSKTIPAHYTLAVALLATGVGNAIVPMTHDEQYHCGSCCSVNSWDRHGISRHWGQRPADKIAWQ